MANMNMTAHTPGLAEIFSQLAGGGGGVNDLISADLNRARRDQIGVQTQLSQAELAAAQAQAENLANLQAILADPALATTPEGRASLMSVLAGVPDGLEHGPGFGLGAATFVNPEVFTPGELSQAAFGTGVQTDYSKTPDGTLAGLLNALEIAEMENATTLEQTRIQENAETQRSMLPGGGSSNRVPPLVNGSVLETLGEQVDASFGAQFPGATVDPAFRQDVLSRASQIYQTTRNAQTAIEQALAEFSPAVEGAHGGFFGIGASGGTVKGYPSAAPATDAAQATTPAATPAQPAAEGAVPATSLPPSLRNVQQDPATGGFVLIQNGKAVPLKDGQTAVSPSNPDIKLVFRGGQWFLL